MARRLRIVVPGYPHHIVQRGHNRKTVFVADEDYFYYLDTLQEFKAVFKCKVYAFCLMTNHVHLIIEPGEDARGLGLLMKRLAGRQTRYVNRQERRTGTLWEGRFKSSPIQSESYLLACCRYVELNPVRAGLVAEPESYRWSSYAHKIGAQSLPWLDADPCYLTLAATEGKRRRAYAKWVQAGTTPGEQQLIRHAIQHGLLTGNQRFVEEVSTRLRQRLQFRPPGRPRKEQGEGDEK